MLFVTMCFKNKIVLILCSYKKNHTIILLNSFKWDINIKKNIYNIFCILDVLSFNKVFVAVLQNAHFTLKQKVL